MELVEYVWAGETVAKHTWRLIMLFRLFDKMVWVRSSMGLWAATGTGNLSSSVACIMVSRYSSTLLHVTWNSRNRLSATSRPIPVNLEVQVVPY